MILRTEIVNLFAGEEIADLSGANLSQTNLSEANLGQTFWGLVAGSGLVLPWLLQSSNLIGPRRRKSGLDLLISLLVLVGGYFLRKTMIEARHASSKDACTTLWNAKSRG